MYLVARMGHGFGRSWAFTWAYTRVRGGGAGHEHASWAFHEARAHSTGSEHGHQHRRVAYRRGHGNKAWFATPCGGCKGWGYEAAYSSNMRSAFSAEPAAFSICMILRLCSACLASF